MCGPPVETSGIAGDRAVNCISSNFANFYRWLSFWQSRACWGRHMGRVFLRAVSLGNATNNQAEILAAHVALRFARFIQESDPSHFHSVPVLSTSRIGEEDLAVPSSSTTATADLVVDSMYLAKLLRRESRPRKNLRLVIPVLCVAARWLNLRVTWTRAHVGHQWNELADKLAKWGAQGCLPQRTEDIIESNV